MATGPKIVHKQFNSPIGLYSQNNIKETLDKHLQNLGNGTVGIDFSDPTTAKPANLANSAVLRMLEEEERSRRGNPKLHPSQVRAILATRVRANRRFDDCWPPKPDQGCGIVRWKCQLNANGQVYPEYTRATTGQKKVVWPPVPETNGYHNQPQQQAPIYNNVQAHPQQQEPQAHQHQPHIQHQPPQPRFQPQVQSQPHYQAQQQPAYSEGLRQEACGLSKLIPVGPGADPVAPFHPGPPSPGLGQPYRPQSTRWAPVPAPVSPQAYGSQPVYPQQSSPQPQAFSPQPCVEPPYQPPQRQYEPPPATITLRQSTPVHQPPPAVYASQPAAASFQGGVNMRGDQKWPPQPIREAVAAENEARRQLAKGPACRPRKVKRDYSSFFAQNALNHNYPGYRAPPGTQHYEDLSGRSSY